MMNSMNLTGSIEHESRGYQMVMRQKQVVLANEPSHKRQAAWIAACTCRGPIPVDTVAI